MDEPQRGKRPESDRASWRQTLSLAIIALVVAGALALTPQWRRLEALSFDLTSTLAPKQPPALSSVIVAIDEPSLADFGQWPWRRDLHARLIEQLRAAGAKGIVLDLVFAEPSPYPDADAALAQALGRDVVLAADQAKVNDPSYDLDQRIEPLDILMQRGAASGLARVRMDPDGVVRPMLAADDALAAVALHAFVPDAPPAPATNGRLIQYFGPARTYPTASYYQALDPGTYLPAGTFATRSSLSGSASNRRRT